MTYRQLSILFSPIFELLLGMPVPRRVREPDHVYSHRGHCFAMHAAEFGAGLPQPLSLHR